MVGATIVLLPGLDGTGLLFTDFVKKLSPDIKVIVVSYPGDQAQGYTALEAVARSFLPQHEPYFLLAESFSGPIGINIAASAPVGLQGLILCCSFARTPVPVLAPFRCLLGALPMSVVPRSWLSFFLLGQFATPTLCSTLTNALSKVQGVALKARVHAVLTVDASNALRQIKLPILYLRASQDRVVRPACAIHVQGQAAHTQVEEFVAPHFLLQVASAQAAACVMAFMGWAVYDDSE